jgi:formate dehydrogenase major subunit
MNKVRQADLGTPAPASTDTVQVEIDGMPATVNAGSSILRAARETGVDIPKLCATDSLKPFGSCRMCLVEVEGRKGYPASCTTPVEDGMKIRTQTSELSKLRRNVMELYISDHPLDCLTCSANGDCELQEMAKTIWTVASTPATPTFSSMPASASSAQDVYAPATKFRVRSR